MIDEFLAKLAESPLFEINRDDLTKFNPVRATPTLTEWAWEYELRLPLKKPLAVGEPKPGKPGKK